MAVVWGVVEGLRGHLTLASTPGEGSAFTVFIPVARPEDLGALAGRSNEHPAAPPPPARPERLRVLLVEDNELVRETLREVLGEAGHEVVCANDGEAGWAALEAAAQSPFDLLLTDLNLPRLSGRDLLFRLQGRGRARAVLVLSGVVEPRLEVELRELGVAQVLHKPIGMADLLAAIHTVCASLPGRGVAGATQARA